VEKIREQSRPLDEYLIVTANWQKPVRTVAGRGARGSAAARTRTSGCDHSV